jgi:hypothetical protein
MPITRQVEPVYKLVCDNTDCGSEDWTALDPDDEIKYFDDQQHARTLGQANCWEVSDRVLCPRDAAEAREQREQAADIAAAVADALTEG